MKLRLSYEPGHSPFLVLTPGGALFHADVLQDDENLLNEPQGLMSAPPSSSTISESGDGDDTVILPS